MFSRLRGGRTPSYGHHLADDRGDIQQTTGIPQAMTAYKTMSGADVMTALLTPVGAAVRHGCVSTRTDVVIAITAELGEFRFVYTKRW